MTEEQGPDERPTVPDAPDAPSGTGPRAGDLAAGARSTARPQGGGAGSTARGQGGGAGGARGGRRERKQVLLRLDPAVHDALARWAADELRSVNAQIDLLLRRALKDAGRMPTEAAPPPRRGRPPASD